MVEKEEEKIVLLKRVFGKVTELLFRENGKVEAVFASVFSFPKTNRVVAFVVVVAVAVIVGFACLCKRKNFLENP